MTATELTRSGPSSFESDPDEFIVTPEDEAFIDALALHGLEASSLPVTELDLDQLQSRKLIITAVNGEKSRADHDSDEKYLQLVERLNSFGYKNMDTSSAHFNLSDAVEIDDALFYAATIRMDIASQHSGTWRGKASRIFQVRFDESLCSELKYVGAVNLMPDKGIEEGQDLEDLFDMATSEQLIVAQDACREYLIDRWHEYDERIIPLLSYCQHVSVKE